MKQPKFSIENEKGQSLIAVLITAIVLAFFAAALVKYVQVDQSHRVAAKVKSGSLAVADAALQRAVNFLNTGNNWYSTFPLASGFNGIVSGSDSHTEIPGYTYYLDIRAGALSNTSNPKVPAAVDTWRNDGDLTFDRTIVVRVVEDTSQRETRLATVVRRPDKVPVFPPIRGIQSYGPVGLGSTWTGDSYDSCAGPYAGSNICTCTGTEDCDGTVQSGGDIDDATGDWCLDAEENAEIDLPMMSIPADAIFVPGVNGNGDISSNSSIYIGPAPVGGIKRYKVRNLTMGGNSYLNMDPSGGRVELYVYGEIKMNNKGIISRTGDESGDNNPGGSPTKAWVVVTAHYQGASYDSGDNCGDHAGPGDNEGGDVEIGGNTGFEVVLYAPGSFVNIGGGNDYYGAIVSKEMCVNGGGNAGFHYDSCLNAGGGGIDRYGNPPIVTGSWSSYP